MKGPEGEKEVLAVEKILTNAGFSLRKIDRLVLPGGNGERTLITLELLVS